MGLLGVARANTAVGASPEAILLQLLLQLALHRGTGMIVGGLRHNTCWHLCA
jgi:hypothetical protein